MRSYLQQLRLSSPVALLPRVPKLPLPRLRAPNQDDFFRYHRRMTGMMGERRRQDRMDVVANEANVPVWSLSKHISLRRGCQWQRRGGALVARYAILILKNALMTA
jgi:hypothetical protein